MLPSDREEIERAAEAMENNALRVIALAYKDAQTASDFDVDEMVPDQNGVFKFEEEKNVFLALFGITDVLRSGVKAAVLQCQRAGIRVRMITGDSRLTATAVAKKCGILDADLADENAVMEGKQFMELVGGVVCSYCRTEKCPCDTGQTADLSSPSSRASSSPNKSSPLVDIDTDQGSASKFKSAFVLKGNLKPTSSPRKKPIASPRKQVKFNEQNQVFEGSLQKRKAPEPEKKRARVDVIKNQREFDLIIQKLAVLARSRPQDKYAMVVGLKNAGHIVAVTGDGTNDAPALSKADVGFAMGIAGTDYAKNAADIIITDDQFSSIVSAIVRGRNVYDSIRKFLVFQLTVNVVAVVGTFLTAITLNHAVISAVQMLWINLIMDTLASLALATEPPAADELLRRRPYAKSDHILSAKMVKHIAIQSGWQLCVLAILILAGDRLFADVKVTLLDQGRPQLTAERSSGVQATLHSTYIFNTFVFLQIFNFLNCRRLYDEFNIFKGIRQSRIFVAIWLLIVGLQVLIANFGGRSFNIAFLVGFADAGHGRPRLDRLGVSRPDRAAGLLRRSPRQRRRLLLLLQKAAAAQRRLRAAGARQPGGREHSPQVPV